MEEPVTKPKSSKGRKEKIPAAVRKIVWAKYIGQTKHGKCMCCSVEDISDTNFECGHIVSESAGGTVDIENLRPICGHCNRSWWDTRPHRKPGNAMHSWSIGKTNMEEFMTRYKIPKPGNWGGVS